MSYLVIAVPEVDTAAADFTITVTGRSPGAGEDVTPDIDVIGVLPRPARDGQPAVAELQDAVSGARGVEMLTLDHELKTRSGLHLASATALAPTFAAPDRRGLLSSPRIRCSLRRNAQSRQEIH